MSDFHAHACQDLAALQGYQIEKLDLGSMSYKELNALSGSAAALAHVFEGGRQGLRRGNKE